MHGGRHGGGHGHGHGGGARRGRRFYGNAYPYYTEYVDPIVVEVERSAPPLPWRVVVYTAGAEHMFFGSSAAEAIEKARSAVRTQKIRVKRTVLQRWNGSAWAQPRSNREL